MNTLSFGNISNQLSFDFFKNLFITDIDKHKDFVCFNQLIRANQIEKALSLYSIKNQLIDLTSSVFLVVRFCDFKSFQKYEQFCQKKIPVSGKSSFYMNALNWSIATDSYNVVSYLYHQNELKAEWFNENLFKIAVENDSKKMIDFFIHQVRLPLSQNVKELLQEKNPSLINSFLERMPFVAGDQTDFQLFVNNFKENKLFPVKSRTKIKFNI